jgi:hypothetical protein
MPFSVWLGLVRGRKSCCGRRWRRRSDGYAKRASSASAEPEARPLEFEARARRLWPAGLGLTFTLPFVVYIGAPDTGIAVTYQDAVAAIVALYFGASTPSQP